MSKELEIIGSGGELAPASMAHSLRRFTPLVEIDGIARMIVSSGIYPQWKTPEALCVLMMLCEASGQHPIQVLEEFDCIQGRPARKSIAMLSRFRASGGRIQWDAATDDCVSGTFVARDGSSITVSWTMARAQKAGLTGKDNWKHYPQQMLRARCQAEAIRAIAPEVLMGHYTVEEVQDMPPLAVVSVDSAPEPKPLPSAPVIPPADNNRLLNAAIRLFGVKAIELGYQDIHITSGVKMRQFAISVSPTHANATEDVWRDPATWKTLRDNLTAPVYADVDNSEPVAEDALFTVEATEAAANVNALTGGL